LWYYTEVPDSYTTIDQIRKGNDVGTELTQAERLLAAPDGFREFAMTFPDNVEKTLSAVKTPQQAELRAREAAAIAQLAEAHGLLEESNRIGLGWLMLLSEVGRMLPKQAGPGRGKKDSQACDSFSPMDRHRYRKLYGLRGRNNTVLKQYANQCGQERVSINGFLRYCNSDSIIAAKHGSGQIEWYTPSVYIESARKVMGSIDLDPASSTLAQKIVKAGQFFTSADDGLQYEWDGNIFLNPPFKMPLIKLFVSALCNSLEDNSVSQAVLLTNNNTDTSWWQRAASLASAVCFTSGRISFYGPGGESSSPTNGQTFFYFGNQESVFVEEFKQYGVCMRVSEQR
jgi:hypothetical protein